MPRAASLSGRSGRGQSADRFARPSEIAEVRASYALLKGARQGHLDAKYREAGRRAYAGVLKQFVRVDDKGLVNLDRVCQVAGLGGDPEKEQYRSGSFEYYIGERIRSNDPKGVGPFILASLEMEALEP